MDVEGYKVKKIKLSPELAFTKIKSWCAYQERSQQETRRKLADYGLDGEDVEELISRLIGDNFLNEERFALALAGGKFRMKQWGRNKIRGELKKHKISEYLIHKALAAIPEEEYDKTIRHVIEKKIRLSRPGAEKEFYRLLNYLVSRGFESDIAAEHVTKILK